MNRLLSRRDRNGAGHRRDHSRENATIDKDKDKKARPLSGDGLDTIISLFKGDPQKKLDKELNKKIHTIKERLHKAGYTGIGEEQINYALTSQHAGGDVDRGYEIALLFQQSVEGEIKEYNPTIDLLGAENRNNVTCYLDSLLFGMFGNLASFEPILHAKFDDEPRRRLSTLIRLWVNMLRTGKLIPVDVTKYLQEALAACGWEEAARLEQQDAAEAFRFITEKLELPLLTMKVDIFHPGREDDEDDHKYIHERLLEVAVPENAPSDRPITLEYCLENYFNNQIEVQRREIALKRSNTLSSVQSGFSYTAEKATSQHVEISELAWSTPNTPTSSHAPATPISTSSTRNRAMSIIRPLTPEQDENDPKEGPSKLPEAHEHSSTHKGSTRKGREVMMPAWQFFNLIPWYTSEGSPTGDSGVFTNFSKTRPVLGVCLKRYGFADGKPTRNGAFIDIPLDLRLPHFVNDGKNPEDEHLAGNFKLSLQSAICHRGKTTSEGHYISIIRGTPAIPDGDSQSSRRLSDADRPPHYSEQRWIKFDDLANPRVTYVNIDESLKNETPYLLFYQIVQLDDISADVSASGHPPSYTDSGIAMQSTQSSPELRGSPEKSLRPGYFDGAKDESMPIIRLSSENERPRSPRRSDSPENTGDRRPSIAFTESSLTSTSPSIPASSAPPTPNEETTAQRISRAAVSFTKSRNKSRPTSQSGENRISATFSRLNLMRSKEQLNRPDIPKDAIAIADGTAEPRKSITIDDRGLKVGDGILDQSKSKKEKKRDKSRGRTERSDDEKHHNTHKTRGKSKESKGVPERECKLM